jgi:hypothetical protein
MRKLLAAIGLAAALSLWLMAASAGATQPVVRLHVGPVTGDPLPETWCGEVEGTAVNTVVEDYREDASGSFIDTFRFTSVFTATATGKSLESSGSGVAKVEVIDNGDGTITFAERDAGLALFFKIPGGPILKAADGEPLRSAGEVSSTATFDIATGDEISFSESFHGPHLFRQGVDVCGPSIAYLLDP